MFNELEAFNRRDQLAFAFVRDHVNPMVKMNMFEVEVFEQIVVEYRHNLKKIETFSYEEQEEEQKQKSLRIIQKKRRWLDYGSWSLNVQRTPLSNHFSSGKTATGKERDSPDEPAKCDFSSGLDHQQKSYEKLFALDTGDSGRLCIRPKAVSSESWIEPETCWHSKSFSLPLDPKVPYIFTNTATDAEQSISQEEVLCNISDVWTSNSLHIRGNLGKNNSFTKEATEVETNQSEWERREQTAYCRIQILREKPCVISGHKGDNTIPGQRRRNRKRGFPIWHLRTLFMKQGERCVRKFKKHKICECVGRIRRLPGGCSGKRASSGMSGDQRGGESGGGGRKRAGGRRRAGGWRHNEGEESTGAMEKSN
ncbi:hypothetical protein Bca101_077137 [Brassica carinata]